VAILAVSPPAVERLCGCTGKKGFFSVDCTPPPDFPLTLLSQRFQTGSRCLADHLPFTSACPGDAFPSSSDSGGVTSPHGLPSWTLTRELPQFPFHRGATVRPSPFFFSFRGLCDLSQAQVARFFPSGSLSSLIFSVKILLVGARVGGFSSSRLVVLSSAARRLRTEFVSVPGGPLVCRPCSRTSPRSPASL